MLLCYTFSVYFESTGMCGLHCVVVTRRRVNVEHYESLVSMGFPKGGAAEALKQSNNDITLSFQVFYHDQILFTFLCT